MAGKVVAIHQPNFFPWLGYFDKIARADVFVVLDNVQFPKKGGTWVNRVRLLTGGKATWVTLPVVRAYHGLRLIRDMAIDNSFPWRAKVLKTIDINYRRAPYFKEVWPVVTELISNPTESLAEYNLTTIRTLSELLGLDTSTLIIGSTLEAGGQATDLLIDIVNAVDGTTYLCGGGATGYQDDELFAAAGIGLVYQDFHHPVYVQRTAPDFVPGLSIVDALMNCGFDHTGHLLRAARIES